VPAGARRFCRMFAFATAVALSLLPREAAWSLTRQDVDRCVNTGNAYPPDIRIAGCTVVIESGQWSGHGLVWAYVNRGLAHAAKSDPRAIADFDEAIKIEPQQIRALFERGRFYAAALGDLDRAVQDFDAAIAVDPRYTDALTYRGGIRRRNGNYDGAIKDFTASLAVNDDARIHVARGGAYRAKGDHERALADYEEALTLAPGRAALIEARGQANFSMARYEAAATDFSGVLDFDAASAAAAVWLYLSRARAGEQSAADADLAARAPKLRQPEWPFAAVSLFLGRGTVEATLAAATRPNERCEARIFVGEWHLLHGDAAAAARTLASIDDDCPKFFIDYHELAQAERKRIER
jgi:tetratricopeptide (TPR) repeat protein